MASVQHAVPHMLANAVDALAIFRRAEFLLPPSAPCPDHAGAPVAGRVTMELGPGIAGVGGAHGAETIEDSGEELGHALVFHVSRSGSFFDR
jgi:hypothetical protein